MIPDRERASLSRHERRVLLELERRLRSDRELDRCFRAYRRLGRRRAREGALPAWLAVVGLALVGLALAGITVGSGSLAVGAALAL
jgi:hypothetical protein